MVSLGFPEEKEKSHLSTSTRQAGQYGPQSKGGSRPLLENWAAWGQTGWVGGAAEHSEAQQEMGSSPAAGEPVPLCGKDSVSNWFCPRHFCSRKITIFNQPPNYDTSGIIKVGGWVELRGPVLMGRRELSVTSKQACPESACYRGVDAWRPSRLSFPSWTSLVYGPCQLHWQQLHEAILCNQVSMMQRHSDT